MSKPGPVRIRPLRNPVIKFLKTHPDAVLPQANNKEPGTGDTGLDMVAVKDQHIPAHSSAVVEVGLTLADFDPGYWIRIEPRSGLGFKHSIQPHIGVIDNGYRGDLGVKLYNFNAETAHQVKKGDKIAQLAVYPLIQPEVSFTDKITDTARGDKGFGSSDKPDTLGLPPLSQRHRTVYSEKPLHVSQCTDDWYYANAFTEDKLSSGEYIHNPMKMDEGDPDYIRNPDKTSKPLTYEEKAKLINHDPSTGDDLSGCGHDHVV